MAYVACEATAQTRINLRDVGKEKELEWLPHELRSNCCSSGASLSRLYDLKNAGGYNEDKNKGLQLKNIL
jgi:hypothetical protein